jgi:hypothetical protein
MSKEVAKSQRIRPQRNTKQSKLSDRARQVPGEPRKAYALLMQHSPTTPHIQSSNGEPKTSIGVNMKSAEHAYVVPDGSAGKRSFLVSLEDGSRA